ncbi:MAG: hypothetical protein AAFS12_05035 [Cyanobacteria bacterium J06632_19]
MLKNIDLHLISDFGRFGLDVDLSLNNKMCLVTSPVNSMLPGMINGN